MKSPVKKIFEGIAFWKREDKLSKGSLKRESGSSFGSFRHSGVKISSIPANERTFIINAEVKENDDEPAREQWANPIEFLFSCIAMSVGLGNIWRFPFVAYENGGGAFLIPYILVLMFIGKPLYYMELCMGQFASAGAVRVWDISPAFRGIGYGQAIATWSVVTYYVSLMALTIYYFFASFSSELPWARCDPLWKLDNCLAPGQNASKSQHHNDSVSSPDAYFNIDVLSKSEYGLDKGIDAPLWDMSLCLFFSWIVLFLVLVWIAAVGQSFFSLSVGFGSIVMFSSYNSFRHNVYRDSTIISITDTLTSFLAGCTIFAILGYSSEQLGIPINQVIKGSGTSLAFVSYPEVLTTFEPYPLPQIFAVLFFLMLFTLGVGSASALTGCVITIICDEFPKTKKWLVTLVVSITGFLMGLFYVTPQGQYFVDLINYYGGDFIIYIMVILELVAVQWVYGLDCFVRDIEFMLGVKTGNYWKFCWKFLIPGFLMITLVFSLATSPKLTSGDYVFGSGANACGIFLVTLGCMMVPAFFLVEVLKRIHRFSTFWEAIQNTFQPTVDWCPKDPAMREEYHLLLSNWIPEESFISKIRRVAGALIQQTREKNKKRGIIEGIDNPIGSFDISKE